MGEREANRLRLDIGELAYVARFVDQSHGAWIAGLEMGHFRWRWHGLAVGNRSHDRRNSDVEALDLRRDLRKFGRRQFIALGEHDGPKQGVLKLTHIAGPVIGAEQSIGLASDAAQAFTLFRAKTRHESTGEIGNVAYARAQGGNRDRKDI